MKKEGAVRGKGLYQDGDKPVIRAGQVPLPEKSATVR